MPATSCTTSAGTPARPACARTRRIRTSSGATSSCRACARRASTSSTPSPTRGSPKIVKVIEPEEMAEQDRLHAPAHRALRTGRHLRRRARQRRGQGPGRHLPDGPRDLRACSADGRSTAVRSSSPMTSGGISATTRMVTSEWGTPDTFENGLVPEMLLGSEVRPPAALLGPAQAQAPAGRSTSATSTSWCSSCARRTTRPRPTASSTA